MTGFRSRAIFAVSVAVVGWALVPACAHDDGSLFIRNVLAPPTTTGTSGCVFTADPTQPSLSNGLADAALTNTYRAEILVGNQLVSRGSADNVRVETSRLTIKRAVVTVVDPADNSTVQNVSVPLAGTLDPGSGTTPSWGDFSVPMLTSTTLAHFDPGSVTAPSRVALATVRLEGTTLGGVDVESNEFEFPIYVCYGCLVSIPAGAAQSKYCSGAGASSASTDVKVACQQGADQPTDCSLCYPAPVCDP